MRAGRGSPIRRLRARLGARRARPGRARLQLARRTARALDARLRALWSPRDDALHPARPARDRLLPARLRRLRLEHLRAGAAACARAATHVARGACRARRRSRGVHDREYDGVPRARVPRSASRTCPFVRNVLKNERLWAALEPLPGRRGWRPDAVDILHAQHVMTTVPAVRAGRARGAPVVATVRDYWPVCYWSDLIHDPRTAALCPACSVADMTRVRAAARRRASAAGAGR